MVASLGDVLPRACLAPPDLGPAIVKADCIRIRLNDEVDPRYVMYALQRPDARRWASEQIHGVGRPRLGLGLIRAIPIPIGSLDEQRRIVGILEDHLSRLDAADISLRLTSTRAAALRAAALEARFIDLPRQSLSAAVARVEAGKSVGGSAAPASDDQWGIIKVSAMTWGEFRPGENKAVPEHLANAKYEIQPGDLLVSRANTTSYVGASVLVRETRPRLLLSDKSLRLVPTPDVDAAWLHLALSSPGVRKQISTRATGTKDSMRNISQAALLGVSIPVAAPDRQSGDVEALAQTEAMRRALTAEIDRASLRSRALRRALLAAAFSGRLTGRSSDLDLAEELAS